MGSLALLNRCFISAAAVDQELLVTSQVGLRCLVGLGEQTGLGGRAVREASEVLVLHWLQEQWVPCGWVAHHGLGVSHTPGGGEAAKRRRRTDGKQWLTASG